MRILILAVDVYSTVGGGQTVYRKVIEAHPEIHFVYYRTREAADALRPPNTSAVLLRGKHALRVAEPFFPQARFDNLVMMEAFARSVAGQAFDIVEIPDYLFCGAHLREFFERHRVQLRSLVLAMHGNISVSLDLGWDAQGGVSFDIRQLELEQYRAVDARYAISRRYAAEWQTRAGGEIKLVDPLAMTGGPRVLDWWPGGGRPSLYCIGRMERRKGNDVFIELLRWLDRNSYVRAFHVGSDEVLHNGTSSRDVLERLARARGVDIGFMPSQNAAGLDGLYRENALVVLPVRYDSFNLVALEVLMKGCPMAVSNAAGVCDYLDERFPDVPYVKIDTRNIYGAVRELRGIVEDYDGYRRRLREALSAQRLELPQLDLRAFYRDAVGRSVSQAANGHAALALDFEVVQSDFWSVNMDLVRRVTPRLVLGIAKRIIRTPREAVTAAMLRLGRFNDVKLAWHAVRGLKAKSVFRSINQAKEQNLAAIEKKVDLIRAAGDSPVYRCNIWRELARLERLRGKELVAASYEIRLMRLLGEDRYGALPEVLRILERSGFSHTAKACQALYGRGSDAESVYAYLKEAYERCRSSQQGPWAMLEDRRSRPAKVAVIVSLYNAAPKLRLFLEALAEQTLVRAGQVELILVDSASQTDEVSVAREFLATRDMNCVYGRSPERETIQAAWNRGIHLARAPYVVFLGVDETLYPEALAQLAAELDANPSVDWVMANSLVTEVDQHGLLRHDIMTYDRRGGSKDHTYLETCYLSWVGGMYHKSIHERFGYYDETFRAAGDTEFKNRVLPRLNVKFLDRTLGLFINYPEDRTTASPVAEIEDTRAWYIHRSPGGVRYAFEGRPVGDALRLFYAALGYRKSYCRHISSDVEYATYLLQHVLSREDAPQLRAIEQDLAWLLAMMRHIDYTPCYVRRLGPFRLFLDGWRRALSLEREHARTLKGSAAPAYKLLNDNRYEQHFWLWNT